jgi:hypothetical protein
MMEVIMAIYQAPRGDERRLETLNQLISVAGQDKAAGRVYVDDDIIASATAVQVDFDAKMNALSDKLAARMQRVADKDEAILQLERFVRDGWAGLKRRVVRQGLKTAVLVYYGLPENGEVPKGLPQRRWLTNGKTVLDGDDEAAAAGFERLREPNQAEIQAAYDSAKAAFEAVPMADRNYDIAQESVAALRGTVDELLADAVRDIRYRTGRAKMDKESERRVMRSYGFTYISRNPTPEEAVEETLDEPEGDTPPNSTQNPS